MNEGIQLEPSWLRVLSGEFEQDYMLQLSKFLRAQKTAGKQIFPRGSELFNAFSHTPLDKVKVVILGQDPYHGPGQAHGLCFSVQPKTTVPPSLRNIFKEINALEKTDIKVKEYVNYEELYIQFLLLAFGFVFIELLLNKTVYRTLP